MADGSIEGDCPAVVFNDGFRDTKSEPCATFFAGTGTVSLKKFSNIWF